MSDILGMGRHAAAVVASSGEAAFDLGLAYSSGGGGMPVDLVQAHRWLNVAALCGYAPALAAEMGRADVIAAQRLARATLAALPARAAA